MRELLDNNARATNAENWYLREFLERLIVMVKAIEGLQTLSDEEALVFAYQLLGAVNYFLISPATLSGIFGKDVMQRISANFSVELDSLIAAKFRPLADKHLTPTKRKSVMAQYYREFPTTFGNSNSRRNKLRTTHWNDSRRFT